MWSDVVYLRKLRIISAILDRTPSLNFLKSRTFRLVLHVQYSFPTMSFPKDRLSNIALSQNQEPTLETWENVKADWKLPSKCVQQQKAHPTFPYTVHSRPTKPIICKNCLFWDLEPRGDTTKNKSHGYGHKTTWTPASTAPPGEEILTPTSVDLHPLRAKGLDSCRILTRDTERPLSCPSWTLWVSSAEWTEWRLFLEDLEAQGQR